MLVQCTRKECGKGERVERYGERDGERERERGHGEEVSPTLHLLHTHNWCTQALHALWLSVGLWVYRVPIMCNMHTVPVRRVCRPSVVGPLPSVCCI